MELSVHEAAEQLGISEATIRRRIRSGELQAVKRTIPTGYEWRVIIPDQLAVTTDDQGLITADHLDQPVPPLSETITERYDQPAVTPVDQDIITADQGVTTSTAIPLVAFERVLEDNRRLQAENVQLAGQLGFYQARIQTLEEQVKLLTDAQHAPEQPTPESELQPVEQPAQRVSIWQKWHKWWKE